MAQSGDQLGARTEIVDAVRAIGDKVHSAGLDWHDIDEDTISKHLYTAEVPDPDLLIRTAGELRVSNFLLWQISYAEIWVTDQCWPEFDESSLCQAIREFTTRDRRFGGLNL